MTKLRLKSSKTERIAVSGQKGQGLKGDKIKLSGSKPSKKDKKKAKKSAQFKHLKTGKSTFPGGGEDVFASMARAESDDDSESLASSASSMASSASSMASSGRYSGSSIGSTGSVPVDRGFNILKGGKPSVSPNNPFGLDAEQLEEAEKQDILARLMNMRQRGISLSKNYTMRSSLAELRLEMGRIEHQADQARSVQRLRRWLMAGVSGAQWATNTKVAPKIVKGKLNGFSDYVLTSIEDYDPIFERMSEKYGNVIGIGSTGNPIVDLLMLVGTQMLMFVFMHSRAGTKPPTEEEIKKDYPDLINSMAKEMALKMREEDKRVEEERREAQLNNWRQQYQFQARADQMPTAFQNAEPPMPDTATQRGLAPPAVSEVQPYQIPLEVTNQESFEMPGPSVTFKLPSEEVNENATDVYELLRSGAAGQSLEELHDSTVPTTPWVPEKKEEEVFEQPQEDASDLPNYEPIRAPESFPTMPQNTVKTVEMPEYATNTRRGRVVKTTSIRPVQQVKAKNAAPKPKATAIEIS